MISNIFIAFLSASILVIPSSLVSQSHYLLSSFNAEKNGNRVILNWAIKQGNTCVGINILRSNDTINFTEIGNIQGICGSIEFEQRFTFIDEDPLPNQTNYYKLELGFSGRTEPALPINFVTLENNVSKVVPNPNTGWGVLHFKNPSNQKVTVYFYDSNGKYLDTYETDQENLDFDITSEATSAFASNLPSMVYNYKIMDESGKIVNVGQFLIRNQ